ncbi:MAG TPA: HU family DNA-binding protein [Actinomycetota bacterium]|nr:HU family DNA-binding protein [Actinomycetota bacterium]
MLGEPNSRGEGVNKNDLVAEVSDRTGLPRADVARVVDTATEVIKTSVSRGKRVALVGFGTFERRQRRQRVGRNPHTGQAVRIPARRMPSFRPGTAFKQAVSGGRTRKPPSAKKASRRSRA